ncbi:MAG: DUF3047 domain-containing protein [Sedimenticola sp.]|nr:DUF3047 domain-containing protein [Sedimenticola sp.]
MKCSDLKPLLLLLPISLSSWATVTQIPVSHIANQGLALWEEHSFKGRTEYRLTQLDGEAVIHAQSNSSASGLFRKIRIDLNETPYLNWQWQLEKGLVGLDERSKQGDDYSARVYVIREGGLLPWRTKALNYVWSGSEPIGSVWPNAFTDRSQMIALRSTEDDTGKMYAEKRNIKADFTRYFGEDVRYVDVVAIMTDTDNSGLQASAYYGELYFTP